MSEIKTGGPAFPLQSIGPDFAPGYSGMTLRQYAAIKLKVPDSGTDWLDEMIVKSLRNDFAAKAMQGLLAQSMGTALGSDPYFAAEYAYAMADAMIKAREEK